MNSLISLFSILVCPIIAIYFIVMTYHGVCDLIRLNKQNDAESAELKVLTKKQTRKYIIGAVIFIGLSFAPHIVKFLSK